MSIQHENSNVEIVTGTQRWRGQKDQPIDSGAQGKLENLLSQSSNKFCADCGSPDPKWVKSLTSFVAFASLYHFMQFRSLSIGVFICIKCSGVHRSLGVHISKVISVNLDEWTDEQVDALAEIGGNAVVNEKYEAYIPYNLKKPKPDSSIEERSDFIRRKYEKLQFSNCDDHTLHCPFPSPHRRSSSSPASSSACCTLNDKKQYEKQPTRHRIGNAFRNSWGRKETNSKPTKKNNSLASMVEFVGLIKVNVVKGINLVIRDVVTSDPYVVLVLGQQTVRTRVIKNNLNPIWNERLMLSIPENIPPLKVFVYDKDKFSFDDFMGEAEVDIQPLLAAARAYESSTMYESVDFKKWVSSLVEEGVISLVDGKLKQEIILNLQKVERGAIEIELECVPLTQ
ncbi:probable ADP-ribosylation factor GTPase-activating protein AGD11 isoform X2 [Pistacia vera]|uniref:probable ADP-ribosylation factor GTPase-activating protein AGD11 isoform X2 n=1 Tax=Pistacia vera TaxID=55513 RepID=UPI0012637CE0|nr:probable ADP-ribosylation factor GTPase-activating protein AGD11 isoform X2 [Pistacia vera]